MKATDDFKKVIQSYVKKIAISDIDFRKKYSSKKKNIDDCITYILNTVKKSGNNAFTDDEIYGMAIHYYSTAKIDIGKKITSNVTVKHTGTPAKPKKEEAKKEPRKMEVVKPAPAINENEGKADSEGQISLF